MQKKNKETKYRRCFIFTIGDRNLNIFPDKKDLEDWRKLINENVHLDADILIVPDILTIREIK